MKYRKDDNFTEKVLRLYRKESKINIIFFFLFTQKSAHFTGKKTTQGLVNTIYLSSMILTIPVLYDKKSVNLAPKSVNFYRYKICKINDMKCYGGFNTLPHPENKNSTIHDDENPLHGF